MYRKNLRSARVSLVATLAVLVGVGGVQAGGVKDCIELVPDDAWGFVIARSLDAIDQKVAQLRDSLSLKMLPERVSTMPLSMLNVGDTVDMASPICAVMLDVQKFGGTDAATVMIVPATDPKALLEKISAEKATDGISKCTVMNQPAFAAVKKKMVILGPNQDAVMKVARSKKSIGEGMAEARIEAAEKSDVFLSISLGAVVSAYKDMFMPMLQMALSAADPSGKQAEMVVKMISEIAALDICLGLDKSAASLGFLAVAKDGSDLAKMFSDQENAKGPLLAKLPREEFVLAIGSMGNQSDAATKFGAESAVSSYARMLQLEGLDEESLKKLDEGLVKLQKMIKSYAASVSALPEGTGGMIGASFVAETDDAGKFVETVREMWQAAWSASEDEDVAAMKKNIIHKADAETVSGRKFDTIEVRLKDLARDLEMEDEDVTRIGTLLGEEIKVRFGAADGRHVVVAFGGGTGRVEKICEALKSKDAGMSADAGITAVSKQLHSPRSGEGFLAVDRLVGAIKQIAKAMGADEEIPIDIPKLDAPVAFTTAAQPGNISRLDVMVPTTVVKAVKEAFDQYAAKAAAEDFDEEEEEDAKDAPGARKKPEGKAADAEDGEEGGEEDEEEAAPKAKAKGKKPQPDDEEADEEKDEDDENKSDE